MEQPKLVDDQDCSDEEDEAEVSVDSQLNDYDCQVERTLYHILLLKPKFAIEGKPRDKLIKIDCKSTATTTTSAQQK